MDQLITNFPNGLSSFGIVLYGSGVPIPSSASFVNASTGSDVNNGHTLATAYGTVQKAIDVSFPGQTIYVIGFTDEQVTIPRGIGPITIIGMGNLGDAGIESSAAGLTALTNNCDDLTLINFGVAAESTATSAIRNTGSRLRMYNCKTEGVDGGGVAVLLLPGTVATEAAGTEGRCGDILLKNCEFAWSDAGLGLFATDFGVPTQIRVENGRFHNISSVCIGSDPGAFGIGSVRNLEVVSGTFGTMEDGTPPTEYVQVDDAADTGYFTQNAFATATNAALVLNIGAGILWMANATEAGWSTARPA